MPRHNAYAARNDRRAEARADLARVKRPAPMFKCPDCGWIDRDDCAAAHRWPVATEPRRFRFTVRIDTPVDPTYVDDAYSESATTCGVCGSTTGRCAFGARAGACSCWYGEPCQRAD